MKTVLFALIFCFAFANKPPVVSKKFKLCGNELCDEVLFKAKVKQTMNSDHEAFLSLVAGDLIDVTAVKFSDRTDLMEGRLKDGRRGNFYISAIDIGPYIDFLRNAIEIRKEMKKSVKIERILVQREFSELNEQICTSYETTIFKPLVMLKIKTLFTPINCHYQT
ncbi:hypothetical protein KIN20_008120 [Parelaphostrongylus tenuis]|uniref:Uncharacterized protein n=1 Tax=Parelaphostrongylus tenuis TaxID=148309 RepID=A0AAD5QMG9_PARTN|nr:hypothetical protein KIN20_008120 [Parelaphostrongylus tenuis]